MAIRSYKHDQKKKTLYTLAMAVFSLRCLFMPSTLTQIHRIKSSSTFPADKSTALGCFLIICFSKNFTPATWTALPPSISWVFERYNIPAILRSCHGKLLFSIEYFIFSSCCLIDASWINWTESVVLASYQLGFNTSLLQQFLPTHCFLATPFQHLCQVWNTVYIFN